VAKSKGKQQLTAGLQAIEQLTSAYSAKMNVVVTKMSELDAEVRAIKRRKIAGIRAAVAAARDARAVLDEALKEQKGEFVKPRTRTFHGIKVGWRKLVGKLTWKDAEQVVKLIKQHYGERADMLALLIKKTETPVKAALEQLTGVDLKKLGCTLSEDTDEVVISSDGTDIDKLVDALLEDASDDEGRAAA
jgi:hypothetical protein